MTWLALHWADVAAHLGLDLSGGLSLKCAVGMCDHKRHQYALWLLGSILISISTVAVIG